MPEFDGYWIGQADTILLVRAKSGPVVRYSLHQIFMQVSRIQKLFADFSEMFHSARNYAARSDPTSCKPLVHFWTEKPGKDQARQQNNY